MKKIILAMLISTTAIAAGFKYSGIKHDITTTASSGGTTTLTSASNQVRQITGALTHTVVLPAANTLSAGYWYTVSNDSTGAVTVQNNGLSTLATLSSGQTATFYVVDASTANGVWDVQSGGITELTGDVTAGPGNGSQVATIANLAVTNAKIANSTIDLTTKVTGQLPNANLADMAQSTVKGRAAGAGTGTPTDLSDAQLAVILDSYFVANTGSESVSGVKTFNDESLFKKGLDLEETGAGTNRVRVRANDSSATWDLILPSVFPTSDTMVLGITSLDSVNNYAYTSFETPSGGGGGGSFGLWGMAVTSQNTGCRWQTINPTLWTDFSADTDCNSPTITDGLGDASAPGTKIPAITFASMVTGVYRITVTGDLLKDPGAANFYCGWRISDGTRNSTMGALGNNGTLQHHEPSMSFFMTYTSDQSSQTLKLQTGAVSGSSGNCDIINNTSAHDFSIVVERIK